MPLGNDRTLINSPSLQVQSNVFLRSDQGSYSTTNSAQHVEVTRLFGELLMVGSHMWRGDNSGELRAIVCDVMRRIPYLDTAARTSPEQRDTVF